jgi:hypothetical protein
VENLCTGIGCYGECSIDIYSLFPGASCDYSSTKTWYFCLCFNVYHDLSYIDQNTGRRRSKIGSEDDVRELPRGGNRRMDNIVSF